MRRRKSSGLIRPPNAAVVFVHLKDVAQTSIECGDPRMEKTARIFGVFINKAHTNKQVTSSRHRPRRSPGQLTASHNRTGGAVLWQCGELSHRLLFGIGRYPLASRYTASGTSPRHVRTLGICRSTMNFQWGVDPFDQTFF